jgi:hypothetical protein
MSGVRKEVVRPVDEQIDARIRHYERMIEALKEYKKTGPAADKCPSCFGTGLSGSYCPDCY